MSVIGFTDTDGAGAGAAVVVGTGAAVVGAGVGVDFCAQAATSMLNRTATARSVRINLLLNFSSFNYTVKYSKE
jgi:hypothetical protein